MEEKSIPPPLKRQNAEIFRLHERVNPFYKDEYYELYRKCLEDIRNIRPLSHSRLEYIYQLDEERKNKTIAEYNRTIRLCGLFGSLFGDIPKNESKNNQNL